MANKSSCQSVVAKESKPAMFFVKSGSPKTLKDSIKLLLNLWFNFLG